MKNLLLLFIFAPIGLFAQGTLKVQEQVNSDVAPKKYIKPIKKYRVETEEGKIKEVEVQPNQMKNLNTVSPDANEPKGIATGNNNSKFVKPE